MTLVPDSQCLAVMLVLINNMIQNTRCWRLTVGVLFHQYYAHFLSLLCTRWIIIISRALEVKLRLPLSLNDLCSHWNVC